MSQKRHHGLTCPATGGGSYARSREPQPAQSHIKEGRSMAEYRAYVGLDIHRDAIAAAVAWPGRAEPEYRGVITNRCRSLQKLIRGLQGPHGEVLSFAYEAGPCGYGVCREITGTGHDCQVVAPGLIPRRPADRVKTDRRDSLSSSPSANSAKPSCRCWTSALLRGCYSAESAENIQGPPLPTTQPPHPQPPKPYHFRRPLLCNFARPVTGRCGRSRGTGRSGAPRGRESSSRLIHEPSGRG